MGLIFWARQEGRLPQSGAKDTDLCTPYLTLRRDPVSSRAAPPRPSSKSLGVFPGAALFFFLKGGSF